MGTNQGINSSFGQLITLAGMKADGSDASNDLTYLMLEIIGEINLLEPKPNIRVHARTPNQVFDRIVEIHLGRGRAFRDKAGPALQPG